MANPEGINQYSKGGGSGGKMPSESERQAIGKENAADPNKVQISNPKGAISAGGSSKDVTVHFPVKSDGGAKALSERVSAREARATAEGIKPSSAAAVATRSTNTANASSAKNASSEATDHHNAAMDNARAAGAHTAVGDHERAEAFRQRAQDHAAKSIEATKR